MEFDHIGYVVEDINAYVAEFLKPVLRPLGVSPTYEDSIQHVRVAFAELNGGVTLELIEPAGPDSPVSQVLKRRQGGVAHLCFAVDDLAEEIAAMRSHGCLVFANPVPAVAFAGRQIAFVLTPQCDIIELVEKKSQVQTKDD